MSGSSAPTMRCDSTWSTADNGTVAVSNVKWGGSLTLLSVERPVRRVKGQVAFRTSALDCQRNRPTSKGSNSVRHARRGPGRPQRTASASPSARSTAGCGLLSTGYGSPPSNTAAPAIDACARTTPSNGVARAADRTERAISAKYADISPCSKRVHADAQSMSTSSASTPAALATCNRRARVGPIVEGTAAATPMRPPIAIARSAIGRSTRTNTIPSAAASRSASPLIVEHVHTITSTWSARQRRWARIRPRSAASIPCDRASASSASSTRCT